MFKSIQWDIYTFAIVALVPGILLTAWGLTAWDQRQIHGQQCKVAIEWLVESESVAPLFENAGQMESISSWIFAMEEINAPARGGQLRSSILSSARYLMEHYPNANTSTLGVLNPPNGLFARDITAGRASLIEHCPETEPLLRNAFPMVFGREE